MNGLALLQHSLRLGLLLAAVNPAAESARAAEPRQIGGQVTGGGRPLAAVLVSDGRRVARTDSQGKYRLTVGPASGPFVFVTTPRGYWADAFFVPIRRAEESGRADFSLESRTQPDRLDFVFIADPHLENQGTSLAKVKASFAEINGLEPRPAFVWAQGDICLQAGVGQQYLDCVAVLKMPVRHGAGNHEMLLQEPDPRAEYHRLLGPTYYSFDFGPVHCIVLDGNKPLPGETGWKAVHGAVEGSEWEWLKADLAAQPPGRPIIVGVHIPIVSTYPERRQHSPKNAPYWEITNDQQLTDLFARHGVRLVLQGHMHENERLTVGGVEYVASISLSGSWWKAGSGLERGVDGSPRGYRIVSVDGATVTHRYRSTCESRVSGPGEFVGLENPLAPSKETAFVFNGYDAPNGSTATGRVDRESWQPMPLFPAVSRPTPDLTMPHHFRLVKDTTLLDPGKHSVEVEVTWPDGTKVGAKAPFVLREDR